MDYWREHRLVLKRNHLCQRCKAPTGGKAYCEQHRAMKSLESRVRTVNRVIGGGCASCPARARLGRYECQECADKRADRDWLRRRGFPRSKAGA